MPEMALHQTIGPLQSVLVILRIVVLEISFAFAVFTSLNLIASRAGPGPLPLPFLLRPWADFHHDLPAPLEWHSDR